MDKTRFDDLTRRLGTGATRRAGIKAALGGLLGVAALPALEGEARKKNRKKKRCVGEGQPCNSNIDCCHDWLECFSGWCYERYS